MAKDYSFCSLGNNYLKNGLEYATVVSTPHIPLTLSIRISSRRCPTRQNLIQQSAITCSHATQYPERLSTDLNISLCNSPASAATTCFLMLTSESSASRLALCMTAAKMSCLSIIPTAACKQTAEEPLKSSPLLISAKVESSTTATASLTMEQT
jgi:hypothetical protein